MRSLRDELKDPLTRAGWTAAEAFLAVLIGSGVMDLGVSTIQAAGIAATSAALTVLLAWVRQKRAEAEQSTDTDAPVMVPVITEYVSRVPDLDDLVAEEEAITAAADASDETGWPWDVAPAPRRPGDDYHV